MAKSSQQRRAQAHHLVAQFYLARWAEAGKVAVRRRDGREFSTGTPVIGQETDFYAVERADGSMDSAAEEGFLRDIDGQAATVLRRLLDRRHLGPTDRLLFARCVAVQWVRGRRSREMTQAVWASMAPVFEEMGLTPPEPSVAADGRIETPKDQHVRLIVEGYPDAVPPVAERDWYIAEFQAPCLLTSDEPISLHRNPHPTNQLTGLGLANADELYYPLTPSHCLVMAGRTGISLQWLRHGDELAEWINRCTVAGPWDQLFRHPLGPPFPETPARPDVAVRVDFGDGTEREWTGR